MHTSQHRSTTSRGSQTRNPRLLREVNERIAWLAGWAEIPAVRLVCECDDVGCVEPLDVTLAEYARLRADEAGQG